MIGAKGTRRKEVFPTSLIGLANIMRLAFHGDNLTGITAELLERIELDPLDSAAMLDLSVVLQLNGKPELAMDLQWEALSQQQCFDLASNPSEPTLRLLAVMGPGEVMANTPIDFLVEETDIALSFLYLGEGLPVPSTIPEHDVAFVAVCESDRSQFLLKELSQIMGHWPRPFLNLPERISQLSRNQVSEQLSSSSGTIASDAHRWTRRGFVDRISSGEVVFPVIARPVNSHAGHGLAKLDDLAQTAEYLATQDDDEFFVAPFIDYRSRDGMYRKFRIVMIGGEPFAAHMAISQRWMVHYLNADMLDSESNRNAECRFMSNFDLDFAAKHRESLQEIDRRIGLDYYSIDCAETLDGKLLVFEIDSGAVVHSMDSVEIFPYKAPQMKRVFDAFQRLLRKRAIVGQQRLAA
jgi:hypothetical protein